MSNVQRNLTNAAWKASEGVLTIAETDRLLDGKVTPADLATAQTARKAAMQLARMTRPVSRDREVTFERVSLLGQYPRGYTVTVKGEEVTAQFKSPLSEASIRGSRFGVHEWAVRDAVIATGLVNAIKAQLVMQTGVETALEEIKDGAEGLKTKAKDKVELANLAAGAAVEHVVEQATPYVEAAKAKVAPVVEAVTPVVQRAVEAATPFVEQVAAAAAPVVQRAADAAAPIVERANDAVAPVVQKVSDGVEEAKERAGEVVGNVKSAAGDAISRAKRLLGR